MEDASLVAGRHQIVMNDDARPLPAGLYFYRITAAEGELGGRFVLVR
jgi:hypothetical protein